ELLAGGGTIDVDGDEHGSMSALFEPLGELSGGGGFTGALEAGHQDHRWRLRGEFESGGVAPQEFDELISDDLDDLLRRREGGKDFGADGLGADVLDEFFDDVEVNVGFEHGDADLFESLVHVFFGEGSLAS